MLVLHRARSRQERERPDGGLWGWRPQQPPFQPAILLLMPALSHGSSAGAEQIRRHINGRNLQIPSRSSSRRKVFLAMPQLSVSKLTRYLEKAILPSWLIGAEPSREQTPEMYSGNARPSNSQVLKDAPTEYHVELQDPHFQAPSDPEHCKSLGDIRTFFDLLNKDACLETILELLEDPDLQSRKAECSRHLLTNWIEKASLNTGEDETLVNWIQTQVILGFLSFQDISSLLEIINSPKSSGLAALKRELFYAKIIEGVRRCTVCGSMRVKESMLNSIFLFISSGKISPTMVSLGWDIVRTSSRAHSGLMNDEIGLFVSNCMLSEILSPNYTALETNVEDSIAIALKHIRSFPDHLAEAFIQSASNALIKRINDSKTTKSGRKIDKTSERNTALEQLDKWWTSLQDCGILPKLRERPSWQIVEHALGSQAYNVLASYLRLIGHRSKCLFFIRHCFQSKLKPKGWDEPGRYDNFRAHVEAQFKDFCEEYPDRSPFVNLLVCIRHGDARRGGDIIQDLFDIIRTLELSGSSLVLVNGLSKTRVRLDARLVIQQIEHYLKRNQTRIAYRVFQVFPFVSLEYVPALAEAMTANPNISKFTAFHYRHSRQKWIDQVPSTHADPHSHTQLRTHLLNRMAYASARSLHDPDISFRQVYKCYLVLKTNGLPFTAELTKALSYAGIVRFLECGKWVPTARYNMIWALVKEVEGQQVADRLDDLVYSWRGKILDREMAIRRKERALALPHGTLLMELQGKYEAKDLPTGRYAPSWKWRKETQDYKGD